MEGSNTPPLSAKNYKFTPPPSHKVMKKLKLVCPLLQKSYFIALFIKQMTTLKKKACKLDITYFK